MSHYPLPHDVSTSAAYWPSARVALLLAMTFAGAVLLFQPFSPSAEQSRSVKLTPHSAGACGFAVTGEADVSGICS
jgi:hypothetical protein